MYFAAEDMQFEADKAELIKEISVLEPKDIKDFSSVLSFRENCQIACWFSSTDLREGFVLIFPFGVLENSDYANVLSPDNVKESL